MTRRTSAPSPPSPLSGLTLDVVGATASGFPATAIALGTPLTVLFEIPREATETPKEAAIGAAALTGTELSLFEKADAAFDDEEEDDGVEISASSMLS